MNYVENMGREERKKSIIYIDEAIMEMKANEFGTNSGITLSSLHQDTSCHARHIRACGIVKCGTQLSIRASKNGNQEES